MGKKKLRAVVDTNVLISALLFGGKAGRVAELWKKGKFIFLLSKDVLQEYIKVLHYPKFDLGKNEIRHIVHHEILPFAEPVEVISKLKVITKDPEDDIFLNLALDGRADVIISGDTHILALKKFKGVPVLDPTGFLERF